MSAAPGNETSGRSEGGTRRRVPASARGAQRALEGLLSDWRRSLDAGKAAVVGARLAGATGALAAALDDTEVARALRRLKVAAVTVDRAPVDRQAALAEALAEVLACLAPLDAELEPATAVVPEPVVVPAPSVKAPRPSKREVDALGVASGSSVKAPRTSTRKAASPPSAPEDASTARTLPPTPQAAASERLCEAPLTSLPGVGPAVAARLEAAGVRDIGDLLLLRPRRYEDRRQRTRVVELEPGKFAVVRGFITRAWGGFGGGGRRFSMEVSDDSGAVNCAFFRVNFGFATRTWVVGREVIVAGPVSAYRGRPQLAHPTVDVLSPEGGGSNEDAGLRPLYPEIEGVGDRVLRRLVGVALDRHADELPDALPEPIRARLGLPDIAVALRRVHRPPQDAEPSAFLKFTDPALRRFIFDELLTLQLALGLRRQTTARRPSEPVDVPEDLEGFTDAVLPFVATGAQRRVLRQLAADLRAGRPMHRLLQGDVGSGKTAVAYVLSRLVANAGLQTALMAPTEVLAQQHHRTLSAWFAAAGLRCALLTAGLPKREQRLVRELTLAGAVHCLVGTHSLLGEGLGFARLGLVVVDEQHRFGVRQRLQLRQKAVLPHLLVMTATPIPRTLAMTAYGDLEVSVLDELPPGRQPVRTTLHRRALRDDVYQRVCAQLRQGRQAYVVFPLVEESEVVDLADATSSYEDLRVGPFRDFRVGLVHGRMGPDAKSAALEAFAAGELDVLVTTTVIEVGIDVANATVMVIEHADRFGLSQLHQLRGRVGRGRHESYCLLLSGEQPTDDALARLKVMTTTNDGFVVAQADLELRGPGEMLGTRQAGVTDLQLADLVRDADLVEHARQEAERLLAEDPQLAQPEHGTLRRLVWARWGEKLELAEAG